VDNKKKILFIGGGSEIALKILNKIKKKNIYCLSRQKNKFYKKNYIIKNYSNSNLEKRFRSIKERFDVVFIFNGNFEFSTLSFINEKKFLNLLNINLLIPIRIVNKLIKNRLLNNNSKVFFLSSKAANYAEIGNAYYSISKNSLNFASKILNKENRKRKIKFQTISAGIIDSKMGKKVKQLIKLKTKKSKFNLDTKINKLVKFVKAVIENKKKTVKL
jgi:short-subunit dehydrogenase